MAPHYNDALVDVRVLAHVDVLRLVRGQHRVDVKALREDAAFCQALMDY